MFKIVGVMKRPDGMDMESFGAWWLKDHAPKVMNHPGIVKYNINLSITDDQEYDGMAEVWFETRAEVESFFREREGSDLRQRATNGSKVNVTFLTEEHVII